MRAAVFLCFFPPFLLPFLLALRASFIGVMATMTMPCTTTRMGLFGFLTMCETICVCVLPLAEEMKHGLRRPWWMPLPPCSFSLRFPFLYNLLSFPLCIMTAGRCGSVSCSWARRFCSRAEGRREGSVSLGKAQREGMRGLSNGSSPVFASFPSALLQFIFFPSRSLL